MCLEYDGYPIAAEKELLKVANNFFKTHANPFLLNINQVFNSLRINGFNCEVKYEGFNVIKIFHSNRQKNTSPTISKGKIIFLSSFNKSRK